MRRAETRYAWSLVEKVDWCWPADEDPAGARWATKPVVRMLAPFDPIVWDRYRFERFWGWEYKFEAYTPAAQRIRGYYSLPLLWRDRVIGWANVAVRAGELVTEIGYVADPPRDDAYLPALELELTAMRSFMGLDS